MDARTRQDECPSCPNSVNLRLFNLDQGRDKIVNVMAICARLAGIAEAAGRIAQSSVDAVQVSLVLIGQFKCVHSVRAERSN